MPSAPSPSSPQPAPLPGCICTPVAYAPCYLPAASSPTACCPTAFFLSCPHSTYCQALSGFTPSWAQTTRKLWPMLPHAAAAVADPSRMLLVARQGPGLPCALFPGGNRFKPMPHGKPTGWERAEAVGVEGMPGWGRLQ